MFTKKELEIIGDLVTQELEWIRENSDLNQVWAKELINELMALKGKAKLMRKNYKTLGGNYGTKN